MATAKITLSASRDIPFNRLVLSQSNVRRVKAGVSIEELAEDIARRSLLQSLNVRPVLDAEGQETGIFEVPAGGRRFRALELLVKQKRMNKTQPVPCIVRTDALAEEDSLAENVQRVALHPLDQFRAFQTLREKGLSEEEIATRFFVSPTVVKQRLKLAAVSEKLLDVYAQDGMTLEQLMALTVTNDHARQEQLWEQLAGTYNKEPYYIRRQLTEGAVRAADKRAQFVGVDVYQAAGGVVMRDLFEHDDGGWLQDPALLDRLVIEKLKAEAETLRAEGWKWIAVAPDFPYGHAAGLRRLDGQAVDLTDEDVRAARPCGPSSTVSRHNTRMPTSCRTRLTSGSARSRRRSRRSRSVPWSTTPPRWRARACSSASTPRVISGSNAAMSGGRTSRRRSRSIVMAAMLRRPPLRPLRSSVQSLRSAPMAIRSQRTKARRTTASSPCPNGSSPSSLHTGRWRCGTRSRMIRAWLSRRCCMHSASARSTGCRRAPASKSRPRARASALRRRDLPIAPPQGRSRPAISNGRSSCPRTKTISGRGWWRSMVTAKRRCSRIAHRSVSMRFMSHGTAARGGSPTPIRLHAP